MDKYIVKDVVCDYGVFDGEKLLVICNSRDNALLIKNILNCDANHEKWSCTGEGRVNCDSTSKM